MMAEKDYGKCTLFILLTGLLIACQGQDACVPDPCLHGGTCVNVTDGFQCTCTENFIGNQCEAVVRHCISKEPCKNGAVCEDIHDGGYECYCRPGYYGDQCELEINECLTSPCRNGGTCVDELNGYTCQCLIGTTGLICESEVTTGCTSSPCLHGATCVAMATAGQYTCTCVPGYQGQHCEINIDECETHTCESYQVCTDLVDGYRCDCPHGTEGELCEITIDTCISNPCQNTATCVHEGDRYVCDCPLGYTGINCEIQVDPCLPDPCFHGAMCQTDFTVPHGYTCQCARGFFGDRCEGKVTSCDTSSDLTTTDTGSTVNTDTGPCLHGGMCLENINTAGYTCQCTENYTGDTCQSRLDGCLVTECNHGGTCVNSEESYICQCVNGWTGDFCDTDINECDVSPCQNNGTCINVDGTYFCICTNFWTGIVCMEDEQECDNSPCVNGGICVENIGGLPSCQCPIGTTGDLCEVVIDGCDPSPCQNNAVCSNSQGSYICNCLAGFTGFDCEAEINECVEFKSCDNNATCIDLVNSYQCICTAGFTGVNCSLNTDDCDLDPCLHGSTCRDEVNGYKCDCAPGYTGNNCEHEIKECGPCENNATCFAVDNTFQCHCLPGYTGKNCSDDVQECESSPCRHGGTCTEPVVNGYQCQCPSGVYGNQCQFVSMATFDGSSLVELQTLTSNQKRRKRSVNHFVTEYHHQTFLGWRNTAVSNSLSSNRRRRETSETTKIKFTFSTTALDGTLLLATGVDANTNQGYHLLLQLLKRSLFVSQDLSGETVSDFISLTPVNQIVSHDVIITMTTTHTNISLDNCLEGQACHVILKPSLIGQEVNLNAGLWVGGLRSMTPYLRSKIVTEERFKGCFGNVSINDVPVSLLPESQNSIQMDQSNLPTAGCRSHDLCSDHVTCQNGGECVDMWFSSYCQCEPGFIGETCEHQNTAHFVSESFLHFGDFSKIVNISLSVSANSSSGMILYTLDLDLMALYVDEGQLVLHLVVNGDDFTSRVGNLASGDWYHVTVQFGQGVYKLTLSHNADGVAGSAQGTVGNYLDVHTPLFLGQLHEHPSVDKWRSRPDFSEFSSFTGCIQNLSINNVPVDVHSATESIFGNDPVPAIPGCPRDRKCSLLPCQHGGTCDNGWKSHQCQCIESFTGTNCEIAESATFNGDTSYLEVGINMTSFPFGNSGSFEFRTRDQTATLMFVQFYMPGNGEPATSLEFSLYRTSLQVTLTLNDSKVQKITFNETLSDAEWHSVNWVRGHDLLTVSQGSRSLSVAAQFNPYIHQEMVQVFVGGKPFHPGNPSFMIGLMQGCVKNITFNGNYVNFLDSSVSSNDISINRRNTLNGCHGDDLCNLDPCPGYAACEDIWMARVCTCLEGWEGSMCNTSINDCVNNLCIHGQCVDIHMNYTCACDEGYTGFFCDTIYNPCEDQPCFISGTANCTYIFPGQFECNCQSGWSGITCSTEVNECESSPCLHGGQCSDMVNEYRCDCTEDYFGERCENIHLCSSQPCYNGGSCVETEDQLDYTCKCLERYSGNQCQTYNFCFENLCKNNATCVLSSEGYICQCLSGFYGVHCQFLDYCASRPCLNDAVCYSDVDTFRCLCDQFYSGTNCEIPINRCDNTPCRNGATCFFNSSSVPTDYVCFCLDGFAGEICEIDIDECHSNPCLNGATCIESSQQPWNFFPGFHCECLDGFYGNRCENETDECENSPCENNATCVDLLNDYMCKCLLGFEGKTCNIDARKCSSNPCQNNAQCVENENDDKLYECLCTLGFTGLYCDTDINDCVNNDCANGAMCVDGINSYTCKCLPGYGGMYCTDIKDACYSQPCKNGGECHYRGLCNCDNVIQTCGWHNDTCQVNLCTETEGCDVYSIPYTCDCTDTGFEGDMCSNDVNECVNMNTCEHEGVCSNTVGNYTCDCKHTGYTGYRCQIDVDECSGPSPCYNGGVCENFSGSFKCLCPAGWTGDTCGQLTNHCTEITCSNGATCVNTLSGYICDCTGTGFQGIHCDISINDCLGNPCLNNGRCVDGVNSYTCDCEATGYYGDRCDLEIDDCVSDPCYNNATCRDVGMTYECSCTEGFTGVQCNTDVDECSTEVHQCSQGSTCENTQGSYVCLCPNTHTGDFCETLKGQVQSEPSSTNTGVIVASVFIIIAIIVAVLVYAYWYMRKSRRLKGRYKPSQMEQNGPGVAPGIPLDKILDPSNGERLI